MPLTSGASGSGAWQITIAMVSAAVLAGSLPSLAKGKAGPAGKAVERSSAGAAAAAQSAPAAGNDGAKSETAGEREAGPEPQPADAAAEKAQAVPDVWSEDEITQAKTHCDSVLRGVKVVVTPAEPIRSGECGAPGPVRLVSIGRSPEVVLSPPATLTCDMVATLADWVDSELQPLAKTHLGAPIVRIETMSSYSCRKAYGRKKTRLSEHALANAIDVGSFITSSGVNADLLTGWGMTERDKQAVIAAAEAAARTEAATPPGGASELPITKVSGSAAAKDQAAQPLGKAQGDAGKAPVLPEAKSGKGSSPAPVRHARAGKASGAAPLTMPSHLGGPYADAKSAAAPGAEPGDSKARFLRAAHSSACRRFGTVLGPEANEAHRNHFHLDMAERKRSNYCE